jgi:hypothetical protein
VRRLIIASLVAVTAWTAVAAAQSSVVRTLSGDVSARPAVAQLGGPIPGPLPLFPADNWWNQNISQAPVDARSASFIAFVNNGSPRRLHPDFGGYEFPGSHNIYGFPYIIVSGDQPKRAVQFEYWDESDGVNLQTGVSYPFYPIPGEAVAQPYWIEGGAPGYQDPGGDRHMLILDRDNRKLYELFALHWDGTQWTAGSGAVFDLNTNARRPETWTSADAAGLAILPGLVRYDEVFGADEIRHAFRVTVRATNGYVWPASHRAGSNPSALPMGARLRLKPSKDLSPYPAHIQKIFRAMQRYGLIVADNGSDMYISGAFDPRWDNGVLNPAFRSLTANDFEVIELGWRGAAGPCAAPGAPRDLTGTGSGLMAHLSWQPPDAGGAVNTYRLEAGDRAGLANLAQVPLPGSQTTLQGSAGPGTYYVRMRAQNACGISPPSNEVVVTLSTSCAPPGPMGTLQFSVSGRAVTFAWGPAAGATHYVAEVGSAPGLANLVVATVSGTGGVALAPPGTYFVRLRPRNACGVGPASNEVMVAVH